MVGLFNIACSNVKKNFKNYFLYVFSMIFSVSMYFIFKSIQYNDVVNEVTKSFGKIDTGFKSAAIVIAMFSAVFIWYSNNFFIRKRKKEIGLYSLLGIEKKEIGRMLFYETLAIGVISLIIGIILGVFLSKIFIGILIKLIGISTAVKFTFSLKAVKDTLIIFFILFAIVSVHGYSIIYRYELIELFKAESKREKEPKASLILAVLSVILIGGGYYIYNHPFNSFMLTAMCTLILVVAGTYAFFNSFMVFMIKISKKNEKKFFKGLNMISTSQLLYRIKGNANTLATIAVLSAVTLSAMGLSVTYYKTFSDKTDISKPFSYMIYGNSKVNEANNTFKSLVNKYPDNKIKSEVHVNVYNLKGMLPNVSKYSSSSEDTINVLSESQLKKVYKSRNLKYDFEDLKSEEDVILFDEYYNSNYMKSYRNKDLTINFKNENKKFKIADFRGFPLFNAHTLRNLVVVKDSVYEKFSVREALYTVNAYKVNNQKESGKLEKDVREHIEKIETTISQDENFNKILDLSTFYTDYKQESIMVGVMLFIGIILGLLFLICMGSIIFFKQISEAQDEVVRYDILRKVGVDDNEIKTNILKQMSFVFIAPLVLGCMHSFAAVSLFAKAFNINLLSVSVLTLIPYLVIYIIYYFVTSNFYFKIVTKRG
ncbi:ABC transporter permease [Haloimpatiens sp. FM7330]|uniref:ABC transporter permease n=1 Tax=Haloimpatiens sp. FM7330 TaxID=3298610 RepID=UPI0036304677